jgi:hypothetical protein
MGEMNGNDIHVLAAQLVEALERIQVLEDVARLLYTRLTEVEAALVSLHERASLSEACIEKERDAMKEVISALEWLLRRAGGRPPSAPPPLSGVN